jgi:flagellar basal body-associated protein FliL
MAGKKNELWILIALVSALFLVVVMWLSLTMIADNANDQERNIKRCLRIENSEAALRCVASEI